MPAAYHVIIADDDAPVRALLARVVAHTFPAVTITVVPDGLDALVAFQQYGADLVITNYDMPVLSGLSLIERLRTNSAKLPIIMVSANPQIEAQARAVGATHFVVKPFSVVKLAQLLMNELSP
jgi:two-component system response regulator YesN